MASDYEAANGLSKSALRNNSGPASRMLGNKLSAAQYMSLCRLPKPCYVGRSNINAAAPHSCSVSRIADQRLARPEQQHQQNTEHAHNRENRLLQNDLDDAGPEPWRRTLHPGLKHPLAGLMDVVPELTKSGETQGLIGDPARAVVDHENESTGQQQQPEEPEKTADHASPYIVAPESAASH